MHEKFRAVFLNVFLASFLELWVQSVIIAVLYHPRFDHVPAIFVEFWVVLVHLFHKIRYSTFNKSSFQFFIYLPPSIRTYCQVSTCSEQPFRGKCSQGRNQFSLLLLQACLHGKLRFCRHGSVLESFLSNIPAARKHKFNKKQNIFHYQ